MKTGNLIAGSLIAAFAIATLLLLLPRFRKYARWRPEGAPMSLRSRLLFPLFPAFVALISFGLIPSAAVGLVVLVWLLGFESYLADRRKYSKDGHHTRPHT
jgi:hypothetical protein